MNKNDQIINETLKSSIGVLVASSLVAFSGQLIDAIVIGRFLGVQSVAAYGFTQPLGILLAGISSAFANGNQNICAKHIGKGDLKKAIETFSMCFAILVVIGLLFTISFIAGGESIGILLGVTPELMPLVKAYLFGFSFGIPFLFLTSFLSPVMQLDNDRKRALFALIIMTLVNTVGDILVAVLGKGMMEMALVTSVSYVCSALYLIAHFLKKDAMFHITTQFGFKDFLPVMVSGLPLVIVRVCTTLRSVVLNHMLISIGSSIAVAALSVQNTVFSVLGSVIVGIGSAVRLVVAVLYGEEDVKSLQQIQKTGLRYGLYAGLILAAVMAVCSKPLTSLFLKGTSEELTMGVLAVRFLALAFPLYGVNYIFENFYQGTHNILFSGIYIFLEVFAYVCISSKVLSAFLGTNGIWISFAVAEVLAVITLYIVVCIKTKQLKPQWSAFTLLSKELLETQRHEKDWSVDTIEEISKLSEDVGDYARSSGLSGRDVFFISLCVEELARTIYEHGFNDGKKHSIDVRMIPGTDGTTIRIRDDCKRLDPHDQLKINDDSDPFSNIGIRMVFKIAKNITYTNTLKNNNLIIHL